MDDLGSEPNIWAAARVDEDAGFLLKLRSSPSRAASGHNGDGSTDVFGSERAGMYQKKEDETAEVLTL